MCSGWPPAYPQALNDDRLGRTLDRLFDADRATLITETVLGVLREFSLEVSQLHNDSTTITLAAATSEPMVEPEVSRQPLPSSMAITRISGPT